MLKFQFKYDIFYKLEKENIRMNKEILEIIYKIQEGLDLQYDGNFINGDYEFTIFFKNYEWWWSQTTVSKNKAKDVNDAALYITVLTMIDCINRCKEYRNINDYGFESFKKWLILIDDEDANEDNEYILELMEDSDIYSDFKSGLDMVMFARNTLTKEELFKFGDFVKTDTRYKRIVSSRVSSLKRKLKIKN